MKSNESLNLLYVVFLYYLIIKLLYYFKFILIINHSYSYLPTIFQIKIQFTN